MNVEFPIIKINIQRNHLFQVLLCFFTLLNFSSCETWNSFFTGSNDNPTEYDQLVSTLPPGKSEAVVNSINRGDFTTAVNTVVSPPTGGDCVVRSPAGNVVVNEELRDRPVEHLEETCPHEDFENKSILYIGDSHSVIPTQVAGENDRRLGHVVTGALIACAGAQVAYSAVCGSRPRSWTSSDRARSTCGITESSSAGFNYRYSTVIGEGGNRVPVTHRADNLETLVEKNSPQEAIINLGDNMFSWSREDGKSVASLPDPESSAQEISRMLDRLPANANCTWVGPTYHSSGSGSLYQKPNRVVDQFYTMLESTLRGRCSLIDSRPIFESTRPNDGLHLVRSESRRWGQEILRGLGNR